MELLLVRSVKANSAHIKTKKLQFEEKYDKVITDLWSRKAFSDQSEKQSWNTVQKNFRGLCEKFRTSHGYGDSGMRVNLSALPDMDEITEIDELLHDMCKDIAGQAEETDHDKKVKTEKKKVVLDITEIIQSGAGKAGLAKLANDMTASGDVYLSTKTANFAKGFSAVGNSSKGTPSVEDKSKPTSRVVAAVTGEASTRKRKMKRSEEEGEEIMRSISEQFLQEDQAEAKRMQNLAETIRLSGEATAAAITASNAETVRSNNAIFALLANVLNNRV